MESRKNFVIIDIDSERSQKNLDKLKKANVKVRLAKTKHEIDEIYRTGGIEAMLIAPQVAGDIKRLKDFYKAPIFIVGEVEIYNLPKLYAEDIVDIYPSDLNVSLLFQKMGMEYVEPYNALSKPPKRASTVFDNDEEPFDNLADDVPVQGFKPRKNKPVTMEPDEEPQGFKPRKDKKPPKRGKDIDEDMRGFKPRKLPVMDEDNYEDDYEDDYEDGDELEAISGFKSRKSKPQNKKAPQNEKKGGFFAKLNQPIGKKR